MLESSQIMRHGTLGVPPRGEGSTLEGSLFEEKNSTLKKKVENHKEASLLLLHLQMEASEGLSRPFRATWGVNG